MPASQQQNSSSFFFRLLSLVITLLVISLLKSQNSHLEPSQQIGLPHIQNFTPGDYGANPQNYYITQDQEGLMYFANGNGILQYDGSTWRLIRLPNGTTAYSVGCASDGIVYVGGERDLGFLAPNEKGDLQFVSLLEKIPSAYRDFNPVWGVMDNGPYAFFVSDKYFFRWRMDGTEKEMHVWTLKNIYHTWHIAMEEVYLWQWDIGLQRLEGDSLQLVPGGATFANSTIRMMAPLSISDKEKILIGTIQKGFFTYDGTNVERFKRAPILEEFINTNTLYNSIQLGDGTFALATLGGGIAFADQTGNLIQLLDKPTGLQDEAIQYLFIDQQQQLWLALIDGISRIEVPSPFTFYADELGLSGEIRGALFHKNRFYAYGSSGFFQETDPSAEDYRTHFKVGNERAAANWILSIISYNGSLIAGANSGIFLIDEENKRLGEVIAYSYTDLFQPSRFHQDLIYTGMGNAIGILQKSEEGWKLVGQIQGFPDNVLSIAEASPSLLWATTLKNALQIRIEAADFGLPMKAMESDPNQTIFATLDTFNQSNGFLGGISSVHLIEDKLLFATSTGFQKFDPNTKLFKPDFSLPYSDTARSILSFKVQPNGDIWFVGATQDQSELIQLKHGIDGKYQARSRNFQHILSQGIAVYGIDAAPSDPNIAWISTSAGLIKYNATVKKDYDHPIPALVRKVSINGDSLIFGGIPLNDGAPVLSFAFNSMRFEYAAPTYDRSEETRYQVWLEGFDKDWSQWTAEVKKDYTNLPAGEYTFRVKAKNVYGTLSEEGRFPFSILPPWYRSWWAYLAYLLLIAGIIYGLVRWRVRQLQLRTLELEALVRDRTRVIEEQKDRLQELDLMKSRFFTNISHEFRTPLAIIAGMMEQIEKSPQKWLQKGSLMIKRNTANLLTLVNQILDLRKLETGSLQLHLVQSDIIFYLRYVLESFHSLAESKNIRLHFLSQEKELIMDYDKEKLLRIISNLLSNAIKFTPKGGDIYLTVNSELKAINATKQESPVPNHESILIAVKDTGIGIPAKKLPYIFDRFYQADDSSTRQGEGTGIGLALAKELIKLMEGQVEVESEEGKGTTFKVILPIRREARKEKLEERVRPLEENTPLATDNPVLDTSGLTVDHQSQNPPAANQDTGFSSQQAAANAPRLLIIEDNPDVVEYLESLLGDHYQLEIARDGQEGIETALEQIPDLIISDVMMPRKDGFEVCETLKTDERTSHIPIVLLTAKADADSKIAGLKRGADAYLAKPFNQEELFIRLEMLHQLRRQLQARYSTLAHPQHSSQTSTQTHDEDAFITKLRSVIEENLDDEKFGVPELCKAIGISRTQLHLKIKALTNRSTSHYIRGIRLHKAKALLQKGELNITQVAYEVGFYDRAYFSRTFAQEFGAPPKKFIKN